MITQAAEIGLVVGSDGRFRSWENGGGAMPEPVVEGSVVIR